MEQVSHAVSIYDLQAATLRGIHLMKKSEIVKAVMDHRLGVMTNEKKIMANLSSALKYRSVTLNDWDCEVDAGLAQGIIKHMMAVRGDLTMQALVEDIDRILKRVTSP